MTRWNVLGRDASHVSNLVRPSPALSLGLAKEENRPLGVTRQVHRGILDCWVPGPAGPPT
jgi:hypothetical protein